MRVRQAIFWAHLAVGVAAGAVVLSMALSGIALSFEPQIVDWADRGVRHAPLPSSGAARQGVEALLASVQAASPHARPSTVTLRADPEATAFVGFGREGGVYVDPYTGSVLGPESGVRRILRWVEGWHRWLGSRDVGQPITGAACAGFLLLLTSGSYLWLKTRMVAFHGGLSGRARDFNWHNVIGIWIAPLVLVTTTTGLVMSYDWASDLLFRATGSTPPARNDGGRREGARRDKNAESRARPSLDPLWARAQTRVPGWRSITLRLPSSPDAPVSFSIDESESGRPRRSQLALDVRTGEVRKWEPYEAQSRGARLRSLVTPLHTGRLGGILGQALALVSAAGVTVLVWTGLALAWRRFRAWRSRSSAAPAALAKTA